MTSSFQMSVRGVQIVKRITAVLIFFLGAQKTFFCEARRVRFIRRSITKRPSFAAVGMAADNRHEHKTHRLYLCPFCFGYNRTTKNTIIIECKHIHVRGEWYATWRWKWFIEKYIVSTIRKWFVLHIEREFRDTYVYSECIEQFWCNDFLFDFEVKNKQRNGLPFMNYAPYHFIFLGSFSVFIF